MLHTLFFRWSGLLVGYMLRLPLLLLVLLDFWTMWWSSLHTWVHFGTYQRVQTFDGMGGITILISKRDWFVSPSSDLIKPEFALVRSVRLVSFCSLETCQSGCSISRSEFKSFYYAIFAYVSIMVFLQWQFCYLSFQFLINKCHVKNCPVKYCWWFVSHSCYHLLIITWARFKGANPEDVLMV